MGHRIAVSLLLSLALILGLGGPARRRTPPPPGRTS